MKRSNELLEAENVDAKPIRLSSLFADEVSETPEKRTKMRVYRM